MNVAQLIAELHEADPLAEVFVSSDEEGNSYRVAAVSFDETMCDQDNEWIACDETDIANGEYEGWEDKMIPAIVFW